MKRIFYLCFLGVLLAGVALGQTGVKKRRPLPHEYGMVIMNNYSGKAGISPARFDHWLHRAKYTCRVCHVDIGFAMKAGATDVKASDNMKGYYCGTCHNGKMMAADRRIFESCAKTPAQGDRMRCERCHAPAKGEVREYDFSKFTERFPRERFGNGIDWEKAEASEIIKPVDFIEGISIKRQPLTVQKDFNLGSKIEGMPDIIFSHKKHTVWNGCELCHPEIFVGVKKGATKYSMIEIFEGRFCGVCHSTVAFPLIDCQRCHTKQVS